MNIRRTIACAYRRVFVEPLHGNDNVLLARAAAGRCFIAPLPSYAFIKSVTLISPDTRKIQIISKWNM
jgi:hypothetical protein